MQTIFARAGGDPPGPARTARAALVDTGNLSSVSAVMECVARKKSCPEDVTYVFVTHIHLDHAGGAGNSCTVFPMRNWWCIPAVHGIWRSRQAYRERNDGLWGSRI